MAEGWARRLLPRDWDVWSAGTHPSGLHPLTVAVMAERGIDVSRQRSKSVSEVPPVVDLVVTLCASAAAECPRFPGARRVLHWNLDDPVDATPEGPEALRAAFRRTRDDIESRLRMLAQESAGPF
jgi:arsenate reductase